MFVYHTASPLPPYPIVDKCENHSSRQISDCAVATVSPTNITCSVHMYYPSIDLYFQHASVEVPVLLQREWNNTDGTRNKSVTITAVPSGDPYTCVASNIPGCIGHQKEAQIFVHLPLPSSTPTGEESTISTPDDGSSSSGGTTLCEHILKSIFYQKILKCQS